MINDSNPIQSGFAIANSDTAQYVTAVDSDGQGRVTDILLAYPYNTPPAVWRHEAQAVKALAHYRHLLDEPTWEVVPYPA